VCKIFSAVLTKNTQISNFTKIPPVGAELFHTDRQTDGRKDGHEEANSIFRSFGYVSKKLTFSADFRKEINHILDPTKKNSPVGFKRYQDS